MNIITKAFLFAYEKHGDTLDDNGELYISSHLFQVAKILRQVTDDEELLAAALLHDTIEDTDTTHEELRENFGDRIADLVNEVTHEGKKDSYGYFFPRLKSRDAILLKFADRLSNLSRMEAWDEGRRQHYLKKSKFWKDGKDI